MGPGGLPIFRAPFLSNTLGGDPTQIRGVYSQTGATVAPVMAMPQLGLMTNPYAPQLKTSDRPTFDGTRQKAAEFISRWPGWAQKLISGGNITEQFLVDCLKESVDPASQDEIQRRTELGGPVSYTQIWEWFLGRWGDSETLLREDWKLLKPENVGKLNLQNWQQYEAKFKLLVGRMQGNPPPLDEQWNAVVEKLPDTIRKRVVKEQDKRNNQRSMVKILGLQGISAAQVATVVTALCGLPPLQVMTEGANFAVQLQGRDIRQKLLAKSGTPFANGQVPRIVGVEDKMSLQEVFDLVSAELRCQERSDGIAKASGLWPPTSTTKSSDSELSQTRRISEMVGAEPKRTSEPSQTSQSKPAPSHAPAPCTPAGNSSPTSQNTYVGPPLGQTKGQGKGYQGKPWNSWNYNPPAGQKGCKGKGKGTDYGGRGKGASPQPR